MDCRHQDSLSITNSWNLLKLKSIELVKPSNHLILCRPLLLRLSIFPSFRVFSNESVLRIAKYWSFSFSISPSNEYSRLISFGIHRLDLLEVQGTLKSLPQHHSSKASILRCSAFFVVQLSHAYMTTLKTTALTRWTFICNVMSLLFNMLSRLAIGEGNGTPLQYSCLEIPWMEEPGRLQPMESLRVGHDWATSLSLFTFMHWRRKWQPTPVFLPGEFQGWASLLGCCLWGRTESDMTEAI